MYAKIINSVVSQEGHDGVYTNYFYYTILFVDNAGKRSVFTTKDISDVLPILKTSTDEVDELRAEIRSLKDNLEMMVDKKVAYCIDTLFPIPNVIDLVETDATQKIRDAGLVPLKKWNYPVGTPAIGIVKGVVRDEKNFKTVWLDIRHDIPNVIGLQHDEATRLLKQAGFTATISHVMTTNCIDGKVLSCVAEGLMTDMKVKMSVAEAIPDVTGMLASEAKVKLVEAGKNVQIEWTYSDSVCYNGIIAWRQGNGNHNVLLNVSAGTSVLKSIDVSVCDITHSDFVGDKYQANAILNRNEHNLRITVTALAGSKTKRTILPDATAIFDMEKPVTDDDTKKAIVRGILSIEPKSNSVFDIDIFWNKPVAETPAYAIVTLKTTYGLIRKEEDLRLRFDFTW